VQSFHGVESVTVKWLVSHEHPVYDSKEFSRSRDRSYPLAASSRDSRVEARELRSWLISRVDVDRLREDPPQIRRSVLADASVPN